MLQGRVDILAANLGYTPERAQQIDFSYSYFVSQQKLLTTKEAGITTAEGLAGKKITAIKGSSSEQGVPSFDYNPAPPDAQMKLIFALSRPLDDLEGMLLETFAGRTLTPQDAAQAFRQISASIEELLP